MKKMFLTWMILCAGMLVQAQNIPRWKITQLENYIHNSDGPIIINFWATFCKPCLKELPYFIQQAKSEGIPILLVSLDLEDYYPKKIQQFAIAQKFDAPIVWLNETNADYFCPRVDSSWSGSIPGTLFINNKTGYRKFIEEEIAADKLKSEIDALLKK